MNHHFAQYPNATAAFVEEDRQVNPEPAVIVMQEWLEKVLSSLLGESEIGALSATTE